MRKTVTDKIQYFYNDRIQHLESIYKELLYLEFNISMIGTSELLNSSNGEETIILNKTIGYNSQLIIPEIFEDLNCSLDLIKSAYFKQSNQILRNTLELITQLLYTESILNEGTDISPWTNGTRGVESLLKMTEYLKEKISPEYKYRIKEIEKFYNLLNRSTHSHKNQLNIKGIGKFDKFGVFGFEYSQFDNSFIIHLCCLDIILDILKHFYSKFTSDFFTTELIKKINSICDNLKIYTDEIENYKKGDYEKGEGYLIFKKHMTIKGTSLLYSYKANNKIHWVSKNKGKKSDYKIISNEIDKELIKKKVAST